ncbi:unnamed protein product [Acidocella sp. C78]|nr:unnamed protein product [Acidocella sp. C78]
MPPAIASLPEQVKTGGPGPRRADQWAIGPPAGGTQLRSARRTSRLATAGRPARSASWASEMSRSTSISGLTIGSCWSAVFAGRTGSSRVSF